MNTALSRADKFLPKNCDEETRLAWAKTCTAIAEIGYLNDLWPRSKTFWSIRNITLTAQGRSPWKKLRQIAAELESRRAALMEAKWTLFHLQLEIEERQHALPNLTGFAHRRAMLEIGEREERIDLILTKFRGAMQDVSDLKNAHDRLISGFSEINEDSIEAAEWQAHVTRAIAQAIRSVRIAGTIDAGNQEYLEQCDVSPGWILEPIQEFVAKERKNCTSNVSGMDEFINRIIAVLKSDRTKNGKEE